MLTELRQLILKVTYTEHKLPHVTHNPDNGEPGIRKLTRPQFEAPTDWVLSRPEATSQGLTDHGDRRSLFAILPRKLATLKQRNPHGVEVGCAGRLHVRKELAARPLAPRG